MKIFSPILKGTTTVAQGTTNLSGSFTGSLFGTAATASYADNFTVGGTLTAQTINVQIITSSIEFNTGSTRNGALSSNTHQFTGSVLMSGSLTVGSSVTATSIPSLFKEGFIVQSTTTSGGGSQPAYTYYTAAGSKRWSHFLNVGDDKLHIANASNSEVFTINQSGSVGIGTTSPQAKLDFGSTNIAQTILLFSTGNFKGGFGTADGELRNFIWDTAANGFTFGSLSSANGTTFNEKMRITTAGNVGIGTTPLTKFHVLGGNVAALFTGNFGGATEYSGILVSARDAQDANGQYCVEVRATNTGGTPSFLNPKMEFLVQNNNSYLAADRTVKMTITGAGSIGAPSGTNIYNASDIRLKQNISTTTYGLDAISLLNPVKFNWADGFESTEDGKDMLGFIAQEVQTIIPEAVESFGGDINLNDTVIDNPLRVNEKFIIPVLVKAIQELKSENDTLKEILQRNNIQ
jgi:hypothetical protein